MILPDPEIIYHPVSWCVHTLKMSGILLPSLSSPLTFSDSTGEKTPCLQVYKSSIEQEEHFLDVKQEMVKHYPSD